MFEPFVEGHLVSSYRKGRIVGGRADHTVDDLRMLYLQQVLHDCSALGTPFPERYEYCGTEQEHLTRFNSTECEQAKLAYGRSHREVCRFRKVVVLKVIRLRDLSDILKIHQIKTANLFIVHLVRHPDPLMMSRRTGGVYYMWRKNLVGFAETSRRRDIAWEAYNYCHDNLRAIRFVRKQPWLRDRYMQVTHRQLSLQPLQTAENIYKFVELDIPEVIKNYIKNITEVANPVTKVEVWENGVRKFKHNPLEVRKNSTDVVDAWKKFYTRVYFRDLKSVESQCVTLLNHVYQETFTDPIGRAELDVLY